MNDKLTLLRRFFNNKYSRNDYLKLKELVSGPNDDFEKLVSEHWSEFKLSDAYSPKELPLILDRINQEIDLKEKPRFSKSFLQSYSKIAAILIIPLMIALGLLYLQFNEYLFQKDVFVEVSSPAGSRTHLNLPDGSTVWLNGESSVKYPAVFNEVRNVKVQGEAFFKVHSDKGHPFVVEAKGVFVMATGTEFNVYAYNDEPEISVILKEGMVAVLDSDRENLKEMSAGMQLKHNVNTKKTDYNNIDADGYSSWIEGKLIFRNAPLTEVVSRMERWYGADIEIMDKELLKLHFKATFINQGVEDALKLLQSTATFNYSFADRHLTENGVLEHTKIYISKE